MSELQSSHWYEMEEPDRAAVLMVVTVTNGRRINTNLQWPWFISSILQQSNETCLHKADQCWNVMMLHPAASGTLSDWSGCMWLILQYERQVNPIVLITEKWGDRGDGVCRANLTPCFSCTHRRENEQRRRASLPARAKEEWQHSSHGSEHSWWYSRKKKKKADKNRSLNLDE